MNKFWVVTGIVVVVGAAVLAFGSRTGLKIGSFRLTLNKDKQILEERSKKFWEDVQYKDFKSAAKYHEPGIRKKQDIPFLLERLFMVKPEQMDLRTIDVEEVHIDSTGRRGRTRTKMMIKLLNTKKIKRPDVVLYWYKKEGTWWMRLESSLRNLKQKR